ncbi:YdcF family protein [Dyella sp.]|uniref:YdcF family protein n=1 Tax=Dyella sp. TaxID=1869338 RepID=UPI002D770256|nr:YdcF family protein [Dyella sp.]HET6433675.1 YdcF family protein [Dyella sp.]
MILIEVLERLSRPWNQAAFVAAGGLLFVLIRRYRTGAVLLAAGAFWFVLCASPNFALMLQRGLTASYPDKAAGEYPKADAIVVLGGGAMPNDRDWVEDPADTEGTRVGFGLQLYRTGRAPHVLLSGGHGAARHMARELAEQGVPPAALVLEPDSATTYQNARYSAAIARREGWQRVLLVTSPMHMTRAAASFRRQGLEVIEAPSIGHETGYHRVQPEWHPRRSALWLTSRCLHEYIGLWMYRLRGRA